MQGVEEKEQNSGIGTKKRSRSVVPAFLSTGRSRLPALFHELLEAPFLSAGVWTRCEVAASRREFLSEAASTSDLSRATR